MDHKRNGRWFITQIGYSWEITDRWYGVELRGEVSAIGRRSSSNIYPTFFQSLFKSRALVPKFKLSTQIEFRSRAQSGSSNLRGVFTQPPCKSTNDADSCRCRRRRRKVVHSCSQWSFVVGDCDRMQCCCLTQTGQVSVLYGVVGGQKCICWYGWTSVVWQFL